MILYTISSNFCKKFFSTMIHFSLVLLDWRFLFVLFQQKNEIKKGNTLMELKYLLKYRFVWRQRLQKKFDAAVFMVRGISPGNSFWVVNTWRAPVRKQLEGSTLNFAHTFLTDCCTKSWPRFSNNELFNFYTNITWDQTSKLNSEQGE